MSTNLEIESKSMLTKSDYKKLIKKFSHLKSYKQINYYISSKEFDQKSKTYGMRIRKKHNKFELTLKITEKVGKTEINQNIKRKDYKKLYKTGIFPNGEVKNYLIKNKICDTSNLRIIGELITIRKDIDFLGTTISIDKSIYNDVVDYEIECEGLNKVVTKTNLEVFLSQNSIKYQKSEYSKLARFKNSLH